MLKIHVKLNNASGYTLLEVMIGVAIIGVLAAIIVPNLFTARAKSEQKLCIDNLRLIDGAKQEWALEMKIGGFITPLQTDLQPYIGRGTSNMPLCPSDTNHTFSTSYTINDLETPPECKCMPSTHVFQQ